MTETEPGAAPLVSVVTPVYNGADFIAEAVESVLAQTYPRWEHVVLDNRSTDRTAAVVEPYARADTRVRLVRADEHVPMIENFNRAFRAISPESAYVKPLCADDWLFPECLARMVELAERHPSVRLVGAYRLDDTVVNLDGLPYGPGVFRGAAICRQCLLGGPYVTGSPTSTMARAEDVRTRERFYDETMLASDTDAAYRLMRAGDFGFVYQVLTFTRRHEATGTVFTNRVHTYMIENLRQLARHGPGAMTPAELRRRMRADLRSYVWFLAKQRVRRLLPGDVELREFHREGLDRLEDELGPDPVARRLAGVAGRLLGSG